MKNICIFLDHDIIIRHFLLNDTFRELEKRYAVFYILACGRRVKTSLAELPPNKKYYFIPEDTRRLSLYRSLYRAMLMYRVRENPAYKSTRDVWRAIVGPKEIIRSSIKGSRFIYPFYKKYQLARMGRPVALEKLIDDISPDVIIHPTVLEGVFVSDLIQISKKRNIPCVYLMNSWDNPSTKALMLGSPDCLVVWGEQSKCHAKAFLGVSEDSIVVLGAAQFEAYRNKPSQSPEEFKLSQGIDPRNHLILFAGSGAGRGRDEIDQLFLLEEAIASGILRDSHVLFRPHPWHGPRENEKDFFACGFKHITMDASLAEAYKSEQRAKTSAIFLADYNYANLVMKSSDIVISGISTMMLEAIMHGKPTICSVYDKHIEEDSFLGKIFSMYHINEFLANTSVCRCRDRADFINTCKNMLLQSRNDNFTNKLIDESHYFVNFNAEPYPNRLCSLIDKLVTDNNAATDGLP